MLIYWYWVSLNGPVIDPTFPILFIAVALALMWYAVRKLP